MGIFGLDKIVKKPDAWNWKRSSMDQAGSRLGHRFSSFFILSETRNPQSNALPSEAGKATGPHRPLKKVPTFYIIQEA